MIEMPHTFPQMIDPELRRRVCDGRYVVDARGVAEAMLLRGLVPLWTAQPAAPASGVLVADQLEGPRRTVQHDARPGIDMA